MARSNWATKQIKAAIAEGRGGGEIGADPGFHAEDAIGNEYLLGAEVTFGEIVQASLVILDQASLVILDKDGTHFALSDEKQSTHSDDEPSSEEIQLERRKTGGPEFDRMFPGTGAKAEKEVSSLARQSSQIETSEKPPLISPLNDLELSRFKFNVAQTIRLVMRLPAKQLIPETIVARLVRKLQRQKNDYIEICHDVDWTSIARANLNFHEYEGTDRMAEGAFLALFEESGMTFDDFWVSFVGRLNVAGPLSGF